MDVGVNRLGDAAEVTAFVYLGLREEAGGPPDHMALMLWWTMTLPSSAFSVLPLLKKVLR